ncbi:SRPBCC family protein [Planomicrobium okeanokoites]|uniref:SRPBCC family protein n=1 Tax=Planomicrobium okeanokoites TaxID=244 RepID=UPI0024901407|nr:SRPBCC family protein [Planomicrobium okeanokoites]MCM3611113.1 SRPBCC family protein [Planococcus sp. MER TA 32b]
MKWKEEMMIKQPIEKVWQLFLDENAKILYPKLEDHVLVENENNETGAKHAQSYMEGKQLQTYIVETKRFEDTPNRKVRHTRFEMNGLFEVNYVFTLDKKGEDLTLFTYEGTQKGLTVTGKAMLMAGSKKRRNETVIDFMQRVETKAEKLEKNK